MPDPSDYSDLLRGEPQRQSRADILYNALVPNYLKYQQPSPMPPPGTAPGKIGPPSGNPSLGEMVARGLPDIASFAAPEAKLGAAAAGKLVPKLGALFAGIKPIRVYHGSPHDFDKFDISKIGTGEGAQVYGRGLYVAEHPDVADEYRMPPISKQYLIDDKRYSVHPDFPIDDQRSYPTDAGDLAARALHEVGGNRYGKNKEEAIRWLLSPSESGSTPSINREAADFLAHAKDIERYTGRSYEANLYADPSHLIDYDKPFGGQSMHVQKALRSLWNPINKEKFEQHTKVPVPYVEESMQKFNEAGIPGIKYLDQLSRPKPGWNFNLHPTRNYVVFNDKLLDIIRKYGIAGVPAAGALSAVGSGNKETQ